MLQFNDFEKFRSCFNLDEKIFQGIHKHSNPDRLGFSGFILPDEKLKKKLKIENKFNYRTLFAVYFNELEEPIDNLQPLIVGMQFCLYDPTNQDGEYILDYSHIKHKGKIPTRIILRGKYYFDTKNFRICDKDGNEKNPNEEFTKLYNSHLNISKGINAPLRAVKNFFLYTLPIKIINIFSKLLNLILSFFTGEKIFEKKKSTFSIDDDFENDSSINKQNSTNLEFFGLKVKPIPAFTYSLLHLVGYFVFWACEEYPDFIRIILSYNFLTVIYVIFSYNIYIKLPSVILGPIIKKLYKLKSRIINKNLRFIF